MNQITEAEWQRQLELSEARFNRKREIGQILQTLVMAGAETLQEIVRRIEESGATYGLGIGEWIRGTALTMLESLRVYTNDAYKELAKAQHMAVPQISERWSWMGIRALYKGARADVADATETASLPPPLLDDEHDVLVEAVNRDEAALAAAERRNAIV